MVCSVSGLWVEPVVFGESEAMLLCCQRLLCPGLHPGVPVGAGSAGWLQRSADVGLWWLLCPTCISLSVVPGWFQAGTSGIAAGSHLQSRQKEAVAMETMFWFPWQPAGVHARLLRAGWERPGLWGRGWCCCHLAGCLQGLGTLAGCWGRCLLPCPPLQALAGLGDAAWCRCCAVNKCLWQLEEQTI